MPLTWLNNPAVVTLDDDGVITGVNESFVSMSGFKETDLLGQHADSLFAGDDDFNLVTQHILAKSKSFKSYNCAAAIHRNHQSPLQVKLRTEPIRFGLERETLTVMSMVPALQEHDEIVKVQALNTLLESRVKERTMQLEVAIKELEAFSYSVSHDLRAPLRAISGYAIILKEDYTSQLPSDAMDVIDVIVDSAKKMGGLIDDLLKFSQMGRLEVVRDNVNMRLVVQDVLTDLLRARPERTPNIQLEELLPCRGDESMLRQVWYNLLDNALKYSHTKPNPKIEVGSVAEADGIVYYVKDNGVGFNMRYADKLFGVFQRLHTNDEFEGTGLGLSLVKRIVDKHNGRVSASSTLGSGSTFTFIIPKT